MIIGGEKVRRKVAGLLGLASPASGWKVVSVRGDETGRLFVQVRRGGRREGVVLRPASSEGCFARAGILDVCYEGASADKALERLLHGIADRVRRVRPGQLRGILAAGETEKSPRASAAAPSARGMSDPDAVCVTDRRGGNPGQWRRFFCGREFDRIYHWINSVGFTGKVLYVVHGDQECSSIPPDYTYKGMPFLNYPPAHPHRPETSIPGSAYAEWATALDESDVVLGASEKMETLSRVLAREAKKRDLIVLSWACTPTIIGDDLGPVLERSKNRGGCPILVNSIGFRMGQNPSLLGELFKVLRKRPGFLRAKKDPRAVNLVDCPERFWREELEGLLEAMGVRVNVRMIPDVPVRALSGYMAAGIQVFPERFARMEAMKRAVGDLPLKTVYAPAPYGLEGSRRYCRAIADAFGRGPVFSRLWKRRKADLAAESEALRREARRYRLAFVADEHALGMLSDAEFQMGIPVVSMLGEMGFGLDLLVYAPGGDGPKMKGLPARSRVHAFRSPEELGRLLRRGKFRAVYSDIFFDHRISEAGKAQFSMRFFEPGLRGALRSLKRLLGVCRLPFYERYGRFLAGAPRGRDIQ